MEFIVLEVAVRYIQYIAYTVLIEMIVIPFILDVRLVDAPAGFTQEEGHTGFLHLPSVARTVQPFLSLVDREVECLCTHELIVLHLLGIIIIFFIFL